jgi:hypothetical protein
MSLENLNLDDKTFDELFQEARELIPRYAPQWTNHNFSDPGITIIDLFAWIADMQIYSTDRITPNHKLKFLKLLNALPLQAVPATAHVTFTLKDGAVPEIIPAGALVSAVDDLSGLDESFETIEEVLVTPASINRIVYQINEKWCEAKVKPLSDNDYFEPFDDSDKTNGKLYIGLSSGNENDTLRMRFVILDQDLGPCEPSDHLSDSTPSVNLLWKIWDGKGWRTLSVDDRTAGLNYSGYIVLSGLKKGASAILSSIPEFKKDTSTQNLTWIMVEPENRAGDRYENAPRINTIQLHAVPVLHGKTWPEKEFDIKEINEQSNYRKIGSGSSVLPGTVNVSIDNMRWKEVKELNKSADDEPHFSVDYKQGVLQFGDGEHGQIPPEGKSIVVSYTLTGECYSSNGLPCQVIQLKHTPVLADPVVLLIDDKEWTEVVDFDASGPYDCHFMADHNSGILTFGDGEHGRIPHAGEKNIVVASYRSGGGIRGNVRANTINRLSNPKKGNVTLVNVFSATGGLDAESIDDALDNARKERKEPTRLLSESDIDYLVRKTPGIRIHSLKVLFGYHPKLNSITIPGAITVVVIPVVRSILNPPRPGNGFLRRIKRYLSARQLVTSDLHVIGPAFLRISVTVQLQIRPNMRADTLKSSVDDALNRFLNPLSGGSEFKGWQLGKSVVTSDIIAILHKIEGVVCVKSVFLTEKETGKKGTTIELPTIGLPFPDGHVITIDTD